MVRQCARGMWGWRREPPRVGTAPGNAQLGTAFLPLLLGIAAALLHAKHLVEVGCASIAQAREWRLGRGGGRGGKRRLERRLQAGGAARLQRAPVGASRSAERLLQGMQREERECGGGGSQAVPVLQDDRRRQAVGPVLAARCEGAGHSRSSLVCNPFPACFQPANLWHRWHPSVAHPACTGGPPAPPHGTASRPQNGSPRSAAHRIFLFVDSRPHTPSCAPHGTAQALRPAGQNPPRAGARRPAAQLGLPCVRTLCKRRQGLRRPAEGSSRPLPAARCPPALADGWGAWESPASGVGRARRA